MLLNVTTQTTSPSIGRPVLRGREVAAKFGGVSVQTLCAWAKKNPAFPQPVRFGTGPRPNIFFYADEVENYLAASKSRGQ